MSERALVLFSGGQDSATCLAWALDKFDTVETVGFDYRQRHRTELECRSVLLHKFRELFPKWQVKLGEDHMIDLASLHAISETSLTRDMEIKMGQDGLPNAFVPGRNLLFFTYAGALAYRRGIRHLVGGMCETDYSGYPDCRAATLKSQQETLNLGMETDYTIHAPLMHIDKAATWQLAGNLGGDTLINLIREETHTCYLGQRGKKHEWGFGCGRCPACELRREGYARYWENRTAQEEARA